MFPDDPTTASPRHLSVLLSTPSLDCPLLFPRSSPLPPSFSRRPSHSLLFPPLPPSCPPLRSTRPSFFLSFFFSSSLAFEFLIRTERQEENRNSSARSFQIRTKVLFRAADRVAHLATRFLPTAPMFDYVLSSPRRTARVRVHAWSSRLDVLNTPLHALYTCLAFLSRAPFFLATVGVIIPRGTEFHELSAVSRHSRTTCPKLNARARARPRSLALFFLAPPFLSLSLIRDSLGALNHARPRDRFAASCRRL